MACGNTLCRDGVKTVDVDENVEEGRVVTREGVEAGVEVGNFWVEFTSNAEV